MRLHPFFAVRMVLFTGTLVNVAFFVAGQLIAGKFYFVGFYAADTKTAVVLAGIFAGRSL